MSAPMRTEGYDLEALIILIFVSILAIQLIPDHPFIAMLLLFLSVMLVILVIFALPIIGKVRTEKAMTRPR